MKRYFIKVVYTATAANRSFKAGTKHEYWYGRQETLIASFYPNEPVPSLALIAYQMKDYGFKNKAGAMKAFKYHKDAAQHESDLGYWNCVCSVEEAEVEEW